MNSDSKFIYQFQEHTIANGARLEINTNARFLALLSNTSSSDIHVEINDQPPQKFPKGVAIQLPLDITRLVFVNNTGGSVTISFSLSNYIVYDNRNVINGTVTVQQNPISTFSTGQVSVTNAATQIKAANTSRKRITIKVPVGGQAVYIKVDNTVTTANGHLLDAGDSLTLENTGAVYGIVAAGSQTVTYLEE